MSERIVLSRDDAVAIARAIDSGFTVIVESAQRIAADLVATKLLDAQSDVVIEFASGSEQR